ncbi:hypothetical protein [Streptomyces sp. NPDC051173]|uniref:hypothetical protein n=1 Tax=Streptomyces sp. NPDC051173 TaxID=3155164 RepID=UPI003450F869
MSSKRCWNGDVLRAAGQYPAHPSKERINPEGGQVNCGLCATAGDDLMVGLVARAIGKPVRIEPISREEELGRTARFVGPAIAEVLIAYRAESDGVPVAVHDGVGEVTGRPALPFAQWAEDHAAGFR